MSRRRRLNERLDDMQTEIDELRLAVLAKLNAAPVKYEPIAANPPISDPLEVHDLAAVVNEQHSFYDEYRDVYGIYL